MADSTVTLTGNLTRDPELRFSQKGQPILNIGLAVSRRYQINGEWQDQTSFFNVVAYGQLAENAAQSLSKGSRTIVTGRLEQRSYETREGEKRTVVEVVADEIGPSLRWATAQVERTERRTADGGTGGGYSPSRSSAGSSSHDDFGDEEPF